MKAIGALIVSLVAGVTTFAGEHYLFPAQLHAAPFVVPQGADWRQQMIDRDPGGSIVDNRLAHLTGKLDLSLDQARMFRPLLAKEHERILALLLTAPRSLTRSQFMADREAIREQTHAMMDRVLNRDQLEIMKTNPPRPIS